MKRRILCIAALFMLSTQAMRAQTVFQGENFLSQFRVQRLSNRILVFTGGQPWQSNHVIIVSERGLVLVDPGGSPVIARELRSAVKKELGRGDFLYVINHHHHWGHSWGNCAFPEALVVGHMASLELMRADADNVAGRIDMHQNRATELSARLEGGEVAGDEISGIREEREHALRIAQGLAETGFAVRPPELAFNDRLTLDLGDLTLELYTLGRGHSETDMVVLIPEEQTLLLGCFFFLQGGVPYFGFSPELDVDRWTGVFQNLAEAQVPIEHAVLGQRAVWDGETLGRWSQYMAELWQGVKAVEASGADLEEARERLTAPKGLVAMLPEHADAGAYQRRNVTNFWRQLKTSAALVFWQILTEEGLETAMGRYAELRAKDDPDVFFDEGEFNMLGYRLLGRGQVEEAIAVFKLNVEAYPDSWNVHDSLGEAYAANGDTALAIQSYRMSVELNPDNANGVSALQRLEDEKSAKSGPAS